MPFFRRRFRAPPKNSDDETVNSEREEVVQEKTKQHEDFDLDIRKITLQLGDTTATFMPDGSWRYSCDHDLEKHKLLKLKNKQTKLTKENKKLKQKFDILFEMAQTETAEYAEVEKELKLLRKILSKSPLCKTLQKRKVTAIEVK